MSVSVAAVLVALLLIFIVAVLVSGNKPTPGACRYCWQNPCRTIGGCGKYHQ